MSHSGSSEVQSRTMRTNHDFPRNNNEFLRNTKAISEVLGALIILGVLLSVTLIYFTLQIPVWNVQAELDHMDVVYDDMFSLKSDMYNVARYVTPKSSSIRLGTRYPDKEFFLAPDMGGVAGTLAVSDNLPIVINYTSYLGDFNQTYTSSTITYTMQSMTTSPHLVYEHGVLIRDFGTAQMPVTEQSLIANDDIYLPIVNWSSTSTSSRGIVSLQFYPYTKTSITEQIDNVTITLDTNYPEIWKKLLTDVNTTNTTAYVSADNKIVIESNATEVVILPQMQSSVHGIYTGIAQIVTELPMDIERMGGLPVGPGEYYRNKKSEFWVKVPSSENVTELIITEIGFKKPKDAKIKFEIKDTENNKWKCELQFDDTPKAAMRIYIEKIKIEIGGGPKYEEDHLNLTWNSSQGIDLLHLPDQYPELPENATYDAANYPNAGIGEVNQLEIKELKEIYYVKIRFQ
jgi:hypothetical protein